MSDDKSIDIDVSDLGGQPSGGGRVTFTPEQQAYVSKLVGKARQDGRESALGDRVTQLEQQLAQMRPGASSPAGALPPNPMQPPPPAPPQPLQPSITNGGGFDIYAMTGEQFNMYSPSQIREMHEKNLRIAYERRGGPPTNKPGMAKSPGGR